MKVERLKSDDKINGVHLKNRTESARQAGSFLVLISRRLNLSCLKAALGINQIPYHARWWAYYRREVWLKEMFLSDTVSPAHFVQLHCEHAFIKSANYDDLSVKSNDYYWRSTYLLCNGVNSLLEMGPNTHWNDTRITDPQVEGTINFKMIIHNTWKLPSQLL